MGLFFAAFVLIALPMIALFGAKGPLRYACRCAIIAIVLWALVVFGLPQLVLHAHLR